MSSPAACNFTWAHTLYISKLLLIQSAVRESTIMSIVVENVSPALSHLCWVISQEKLHCYSKTCCCLRWMLLEALVLSEKAGRRRHERRKGKSGGCGCCLETRLKPFAVMHACAELKPTYKCIDVLWSLGGLTIILWLFLLSLINHCFHIVHYNLHFHWQRLLKLSFPDICPRSVQNKHDFCRVRF